MTKEPRIAVPISEKSKEALDRLTQRHRFATKSKLLREGLEIGLSQLLERREEHDAEIDENVVYDLLDEVTL